MSDVRNRAYRTREFAELAGVTVRALHHYDRLALLRPRRSPAGYRVYGPRDLETLEQIVALKFIGVPLRQIAVLRRASASELANTLSAQRAMLEEKRRLLDQAIGAIKQAEAALEAGERSEPALLQRIIEVIEMQNNTVEWKRKYELLVQGKIERLQAMSPEARIELRQQWAALFKDIEGALAEDPAGPRAQALADRWVRLLEAFTGGAPIDLNLLRNAGALYQTGGTWPTTAAFADTRVWDFMSKVLAARH